MICNKFKTCGGALRAALMSAVCLAACVLPAHAQFFYGVTDGANGKIYEADILNAKTKLALTTDLGYVNGLAFNEAGDGGSGQLFYRAGTLSLNGSGDLYVWNRRTNVQTKVIVPNAINNGKLSGQSSNASWFGGAYWYVDQGKDTLYKVNISFATPTAPTVSSIDTFTNFDGTGATNFSFGDISFGDVVTLAGGNVQATLYGSATGKFFRINVLAGVPVSSSYSENAISDSQLQVGFGGDGATLYGTLAGNQPSAGQWYTLNKTTGARTAIPFQSLDSSGNILSYNDISEGSLRSVSAVAQPEPASLALLLPLAALTGYRWRRRRAPAFAHPAAAA